MDRGRRPDLQPQDMHREYWISQMVSRYFLRNKLCRVNYTIRLVCGTISLYFIYTNMDQISLWDCFAPCNHTLRTQSCLWDCLATFMYTAEYFYKNMEQNSLQDWFNSCILYARTASGEAASSRTYMYINITCLLPAYYRKSYIPT